jgi:hypothetical protein
MTYRHTGLDHRALIAHVSVVENPYLPLLPESEAKQRGSLSGAADLPRTELLGDEVLHRVALIAIVCAAFGPPHASAKGLLDVDSTASTKRIQ